MCNAYADIEREKHWLNSKKKILENTTCFFISVKISDIYKKDLVMLAYLPKHLLKVSYSVHNRLHKQITVKSSRLCYLYR